MSVLIGIIMLALVVFFSTLLGLLIAASIGIQRNDRGHYRALRDGRDDRSFSGAGRTITGLRFAHHRNPGSAAPAEERDDDGESSPSRVRALI